jgi:hypothetical protein
MTLTSLVAEVWQAAALVRPLAGQRCAGVTVGERSLRFAEPFTIGHPPGRPVDARVADTTRPLGTEIHGGCRKAISGTRHWSLGAGRSTAIDVHCAAE